MATCGHRGDLPEPCPLGANAAFLCALFLSRLEVALHCIFVEASGVALGPGMSMLLGLLVPTPSASHWALPSPVSWSEAWPSVERAGAPASALIRVCLEWTSRVLAAQGLARVLATQGLALWLVNMVM